LKTSAGIDQIIEMCEKHKIQLITSDKIFNIMSPKGNCFVIGEFYKKESELQNANHIVLVGPADAGNLGTILRTATGFGFRDIAIIRPAVDVFDPKTVRASMGAIFHLNVKYFDTIEEYCDRFPNNARYAFMLKASKVMKDVVIRKPFSLIFGNEATGLPDYFADFCNTVIIKHTRDIDSLNLTIAAGIAMYEFMKKEFAN
jgi:TrmH family RNA methyltransferase